MMLPAGEHPMWVAKQMGQTDWTMIACVYGRWMPHEDDRSRTKAVIMWTHSQTDQTSHEAKGIKNE